MAFVGGRNMTINRAHIVDELGRPFESRGGAAYLGEKVTIAEHMLQAAAQAASEDAPPALVVALLHDVAYVARDGVIDADWHGRHNLTGAEFLSRYFGPEVCEPVRLHVAAKRYLCAVEPQYVDCLSAASRHTLGLQGGPMTGQEIERFEDNPDSRKALCLRRWDESAKVPGRSVPRLEHYRRLIESLAISEVSARQRPESPSIVGR